MAEVNGAAKAHIEPLGVWESESVNSGAKTASGANAAKLGNGEDQGARSPVQAYTPPRDMGGESTEGDDFFGPEDEDSKQYYRGRMQKKREQRNPPVSKYTKRKKLDKFQLSTGHMMFEEKEFPLLEYTDYLQAQMEIESHFNKKFSFSKPPIDGDAAWKLPGAETMYTKKVWKDEELLAAKSNLNEVKKQLTDKDIATWHTHTKNTNPAERIALALRRRASPEMVTQAWLKFFEIVSTYPLVPPENVGEEIPFHSVHLCEAPGAFIVALNHYLAIHRPKLKWQWLGNSLNPYYEGSPAEVCVVEDKLIYHTMHNWTFGENNTGDLMEKENLEDLVHRAEYMGPIHLVTADGSIDCQDLPGEQENTTHSLHMCEVVSALSILAPGGSLVVKKFTMFESETINLMYLLCCVFQEVHVVKPGTSKEGNSEVYVVCLSYLGKEKCKSHLKKVTDIWGTFGGDLAMFGMEDLPKDFMLQLKKCVEVFKAHQIKTITKNITLFERMTEKDNQYNELLKFKANGVYFDRSFCVHIDKGRTLTDNKVNKTRYLLESDLNKPITSSFVRMKSTIDKLNLVKKHLNTYIEEFTKRGWIIDITNGEEFNVSRIASVDLEKIDFDVIRGKPYTMIKSSKFCSQKIQEGYKVLYKLLESLDDCPTLSLDESLLESVVKEYTGAEVLRTEVTPGPTYDLGAMMEALVKIKNNKVAKNDSLILVNVTMLSRLQCGVLCLLGSVFSNIAIYNSPNLGEKAPVFVLENFKSPEQGEELMTALHNAGWNPFDGDKAISAKVLQLVSYPMLVENVRLCSVYYYNLHYCIHRSLKLQEVLENHLK